MKVILTEMTELQHDVAANFLKTFNPKVTLTRYGNVAIICTDQAGDEYPLLGFYWDNTQWVSCRWDKDGFFPSINEKVRKTGLDLVLHSNEPVPKGVA
jgi:hypothetical protein